MKGSQREDKIHGSLLVLSELLRCSNAEWEEINRELEERGEDYFPAELNTHQGVSFPQQVVSSCLRVQEVGGVDESHVAVLLVRQCRGWLLGELTQE